MWGGKHDISPPSTHVYQHLPSRFASLFVVIIYAQEIKYPKEEFVGEHVN
jgi:hypothetical protein